MEIAMGSILRWGLILASVVVAAGGAVYLLRHGGEQPAYSVFRGAPAKYRTVAGIAREAAGGGGRGIVMLGAGILLATPLVRVLFALISFARERDWTYLAVTAIVLGVLLFSLLAG